MLVDAFTLFSTYSMLEVYNTDLVTHDTYWRDQHVAQGFVWRPGSVGFGLLHDLGDHFIEVHLSDAVSPLPHTVRAIVVPFEVSLAGKIEVTDCVNVQSVTLPPGAHALLFEIGYVGDRVPEDLDETSFWVRFTFVPRQATQPAILRADEGLSPTYPLLMEWGPPS